MGSISSDECYEIWNQFHIVGNQSEEVDYMLADYCYLLMDREEEDRFNRPMPWVGMYIAAASLVCILAMAADLFHGFRNRKLWFPCRYFTLNAASITVIAVAMKLPVDLNNPMPGTVDYFAKLGSMAFMCTMMANLMPSLATMSNKELVSNIVAVSILVITVVVNFCIQISTGLLTDGDDFSYYPSTLCYFYAVMTLFLLTVMTSLALTVPTSKRILEIKYRIVHKLASDDQDPRNITVSVVEKLQQHVRRYWVMAGTGSPQFMMMSFSLCSVAGVICVFTALIPITIASLFIIAGRQAWDYESDYKWSMVVILMTQTVGVTVGSIAPVFRCFSALSFQLSIEWIRNHIKIFKVESYYTQKLSDWKQTRIKFQTGGRKGKIFVHNVKSLILSCCIWFENIVVVACKIIGLIPILIVVCIMCFSYCWKSLKTMLFAALVASNNTTEAELQNNNTRADLGNYVLQLQDENVLSERMLKVISNSADRMIRKAEKERPNNLPKLLEKSTGFKGVESFDSDHVPSLLSVEPPNCWSLPVVTLTSIALMLPHIESNTVDSLLTSVGEGLSYVSLVEESLNGSGEYVNIQRVAKKLWLEVEVHCKWLENNLCGNSHNGKTSKEILQWFSDKAQEIVEEIQKSSNEGHEEILLDKSVAANSMYRITQTILDGYQSGIEHINEEQLFVHISSTITDILAACLTNLPTVISMKCYTSAIEKREESMETAARLLGQSKEMMSKLQEREIPQLGPDQMTFLDEWRAFYKRQFP